MIGFARFTAIIFVLLGVLLLVAGIGIVLSGVFSTPRVTPSVPGELSNLTGLLVFAGIFAGGVVAFQGLLLAAVGQVLWLMAGMADKAQVSIEYLAELVNRMGNVRR